jgi:CheY-like chemotaxis protein
VVERDDNGLLALLAASAAADLADTHGHVNIVRARTPEDAIIALSTESHRCIVLDLTLPDASAFVFLERLQDRTDLQEIPVLAHATRKLGAAHERLAQVRFRTRRLELLPSLDDLRERITLHLSADRLDDVLPLIGTPAYAAEPVGIEQFPQHPRLSGRTILVIDDDVRNVFAIASILELYGITIIHAPNGRKGIDTLVATDGIDLVLMDVMMPEMDGYATMAAIREMPRFIDLPIIAVTAKAMQSDREKGLAAGATDYVTKPVDTEELLACIERRLARR